MSSEKVKIDNPGLFIVMFLLFWLSFGLIGYGIMKLYNDPKQPESKPSAEVGITSEEDSELFSKYFERAQGSGSTSGKDDYYLQTDPFKNICSASGSAGKTPYVVSGIVCYR